MTHHEEDPQCLSGIVHCDHRLAPAVLGQEIHRPPERLDYGFLILGFEELGDWVSRVQTHQEVSRGRTHELQSGCQVARRAEVGDADEGVLVGLDGSHIGSCCHALYSVTSSGNNSCCGPRPGSLDLQTRHPTYLLLLRNGRLRIRACCQVIVIHSLDLNQWRKVPQSLQATLGWRQPHPPQNPTTTHLPAFCCIATIARVCPYLQPVRLADTYALGFHSFPLGRRFLLLARHHRVLVRLLKHTQGK